MKIVNHALCRDDGSPVEHKDTPNRGGEFTVGALRYLVIHYTASASVDSAANWLCNPKAKASAHLVIGQDGRVVQLVPFNRVAWHAGESSWEGLSSLNAHSIGIELDNPGRLAPLPTGEWWAQSLGKKYPHDQGVSLTHRNEHAVSGWHIYPAAQLEAAFETALALVGAYQLRGVVGHDDIAPGRKSDPGPAFPLENFRARLFGRAE